MQTRRTVLKVLMISGMLVSSASFAQPGRGGGHGEPGHGHGKGQGYGKGGQGPHMKKGPPHGRPDAMPPGHRPGGPGASAYAPGHWRKGDRLPRDRYGRQYVVDDWRAYRLAPPPRGYHWMSIGGDFLLVAITTGVIAEIVVGGR